MHSIPLPKCRPNLIPFVSENKIEAPDISIAKNRDLKKLNFFGDLGLTFAEKPV